MTGTYWFSFDKVPSSSQTYRFGPLEIPAKSKSDISPNFQMNDKKGFEVHVSFSTRNGSIQEDLIIEFDNYGVPRQCAVLYNGNGPTEIVDSYVEKNFP